MFLRLTSVLQTFLLLPLLCLMSCSPSQEPKETYPKSTYNYVKMDFAGLQHQQRVYVPVYSAIYHMNGNESFLLTVTASVRNTSMHDTMYVNKAEYYDSHGKLLRKYLSKTILIPPLSSAEFIVEYLENKGGAGASFIIDWGSNSSSLVPLIQGIMIGTLSQQGISFVTEAVVIETLK